LSFTELTSQNQYCLLSNYGFIKVLGPGAKDFLQGQLTCDMNALPLYNSLLAAYCNNKGRIRAIVRVIYIAENCYLIKLPLELIPAILRQLQKYGIFSEIQLSDASHEWVCFGVIGNINQAELLANGVPAIITTYGTSDTRFELYAHKDQDTTLASRIGLTFQAIDFNAWQCLDILDGIPEIYLTTTELFLVHYIGLVDLNAVSFTKGCYAGQEIIARMQYRAQIKRHLYIAQCTIGTEEKIEDFLPGTALVDDHKRQVGTIVRASFNTQNKCELLFEAQDNAENIIIDNNKATALHSIRRAKTL